MIARLLIALVRFYKKRISPALPARCRFQPSCSRYAIQALETHGALKGSVLTAWRICRCNPLCKWGFDPVPEKGQWKNPRARLAPPRVRKGPR